MKYLSIIRDLREIRENLRMEWLLSSVPLKKEVLNNIGLAILKLQVIKKKEAEQE